MSALGPVEVFQVPPGSLIVLRDVHLPEEAGPDVLFEELIKANNHDRFVILSITGDATAEVIGPADLKARLREALAEAEA